MLITEMDKRSENWTFFEHETYRNQDAISCNILILGLCITSGQLETTWKFIRSQFFLQTSIWVQILNSWGERW